MTDGLDPVEVTVIGYVVEDRYAREYALDRLAARDFTSALTSSVWQHVVDCHDGGRPLVATAAAFGLSAETFAAVTDARVSGLSDLAAIDLLRERSWRRHVAYEARRFAEVVESPDTPVDRVARWSVESLGFSAPILPPPLPTLDDLADRWGNEPYDWIIPNAIERGDRLILVAREGSGKSTMFRQWAYQAACGVNWVHPDERCVPAKVLLIDAENSERQTGRAVRRLQMCARQVTHLDQAGYDSPRVLIEAGLDLTRPVWRDRVEGHLEAERPDLVIIGPLYKVFSFRSRLSYEENATQAATVIDDWRRRYGFAVVLEAHAAKGDDDSTMDPRGSGVWRGWPEFGRQLAFDKDKDAWRFGQFRGDRDSRDWPDWWFRNQDLAGWPWVPAVGEYPPQGALRSVPAVEHVQNAWDHRADLDGPYVDEPYTEEPYTEEPF